MPSRPALAALAVEFSIVESTRAEMEAIADGAMEFLLAQSRIMDPSVSLNVQSGLVEIEILIPDAATLEAAVAVGRPIIQAALKAAGAEPLEPVLERRMELLPA